MKHKAAQFELPGTEAAFNLASDKIAPEAIQTPAMPAQDWTGELFQTGEPVNIKPVNKKP